MKPLVRMLRLKYLPVVLGPQYLGFVLAGHKPLPDFTPESLARSAAAVIALGPLLWNGTLLFNDSCDLSSDRCNPRHSASPLVRGEIGRRQVLAWALGLKVGALVLAALVSPGFFFVMLGLAVLSWMYSAEPFRLKGRPGLDVLVNAVGFGALCTISGWTILRPIEPFPWMFLAPLALGWTSLYVPTTMVDAGADRQAGVTTFAVRFGNRSAFRLSLAAMVLSILLIYAMALSGYLLSPRIVFWTAPVAVLQVFVFCRHVGQWDSPERIQQGASQAALLGALLEILVVLDLTGVLGNAA